MADNWSDTANNGRDTLSEVEEGTLTLLELAKKVLILEERMKNLFPPRLSIERIFELATEDAQFPTRATDGSAGYDLFSAESGVIPPGGQVAFDTGLRSRFNPDAALILKSRSGLVFKHQVDTMAGFIDSDYRGNIKVILHNRSSVPFEVNVGDRISQGYFASLSLPYYPPVDTGRVRGEGGFGSTGTR